MLERGRARYCALFVLVFALTCKTGGDITEPPAQTTTGSLTLTISGLPNGTAATVNTTGPNGFARTITATGTIASLVPGAYTVTASDVATPQDRYAGTPGSQSVTVTAGTAPSSVSITYTVTTGRLTVRGEGLPPATNAAVTVNGPAGFRQAITGTTTLPLLTPGAYTLTATPVTRSGSTWYPSPAFQEANVVAGATASATVTYTLPQVDLLIWGGSMEPPVFRTETFSDTACAVVEGLVKSGTRRLMRFGTEVRNAGSGDLFFGDPASNPLFAYAPCHDHYHFDDFALYRLVDSSGQAVGKSLKVGYCLADLSRWDPSASPNRRYYAEECNPQGIQAGWSDSYVSSLDGQWVDITGIPAGTYTLELTVDPDDLIFETDETNNILRIQVTIPPHPGSTLRCKRECQKE